MKKAIRYLRFSSDGQSQHSIERQDAATAQWLTFNNILQADTFIDEGYTARNFDRPDIKLLFDFIKKNYRDIDYLVVAELTRFSREAGDAINMVKKIQATYGIRIVSAGRGAIYDCLDHNSFFMMGLEFLLGNSENIKRQNDINGGIYTAKTSKGKWIHGGPPPYGFTKEGIGNERRLIIHQDEAAVVQYIYNSYLSNVPLYLIYQHAKQMGLRRRSNSAIQEILSNPLYFGYQQVKPWKEMPGGLFPLKNFTPIIDTAKWYQVQEKLQKQDKQRVSVTDEFPLRGVLYCHCKKLLTGAPSRGRHGVYYNYYKCQSSGHNTINATRAHAQLEDVLNYMSLPERLAMAVRGKSQLILEERTATDRKLLVKKKAEFEQLEDQLKSVEEKWINNQMNHDTYHRWHSSISSKRIELRSQIEKLNRDENETFYLLQNELEKLTDLKTVYQSAATLQKQELLRMVFDNSLYYKDQCYRTPYLMPVFTHNLLILNQKQLLVLDGTGAKSGGVEASGLLSNNFTDFLSLVRMIRVA